jgi:membrane protein implicated in regulation of membrane protease activity
LYAGYPDSGKPAYHALRMETVRNERLDSLLDGCLALTLALFVFGLPVGGLIWLLAYLGHWLAFILAVIGVGALLALVVRATLRTYQKVQVEREQFRRLTTPGTSLILSGEVISARVQEFHGRGRVDYRTSITFRFSTPEGRLMMATQNRGAKVELPPAGTPVRVLYADDDAFVML